MKSLFLILFLLFASLAHAGTLTEVSLGGDGTTSGVITLEVIRSVDSLGVATIEVFASGYTLDANSMPVKGYRVKLYDALTATQKTALDSLVTKAIQKVKTDLTIP